MGQEVEKMLTKAKRECGYYKCRQCGTRHWSTIPFEHLFCPCGEKMERAKTMPWPKGMFSSTIEIVSKGKSQWIPKPKN